MKIVLIFAVNCHLHSFFYYYDLKKSFKKYVYFEIHSVNKFINIDKHMYIYIFHNMS